MENERKYSYIKLVTTAAKRNYLITKIFFSETILAINVRKKILILMNKEVYLGI